MDWLSDGATRPTGSDRTMRYARLHACPALVGRCILWESEWEGKRGRGREEEREDRRRVGGKQGKREVGRKVGGTEGERGREVGRDEGVRECVADGMCKGVWVSINGGGSVGEN